MVCVLLKSINFCYLLEFMLTTYLLLLSQLTKKSTTNIKLVFPVLQKYQILGLNYKRLSDSNFKYLRKEIGLGVFIAKLISYFLVVLPIPVFPICLVIISGKISTYSGGGVFIVLLSQTRAVARVEQICDRTPKGGTGGLGPYKNFQHVSQKKLEIFLCLKSWCVM